MTAQTRHDEGFTLTELMVVLSLLTVILGVAYLGFDVVRSGSNLSDRIAYTSREVGFPLDFMERVLIQNYGFDNTTTPTNYKVTVLTDRDNNDRSEKYIFEATSAGTLRVLSLEEPQTSFKTYVLSTKNTNIAQSKPLFRYYDANLNEITNMNNVSSLARSMTMTIVTTYDGQSFSDTRRVYFRNR
jgi:prepilin-type N-terminal cleavage/methylation domain-containing protein